MSERATDVASTVVVAEDEWLIARHITEILTEAGYRVGAVVRSAAALLAVIDELRPSIILVDISLEARDSGLAVVEQHALAARTAVVFVTAHSDAATLERATRARCSAYVVKPFSSAELVTVLDAVGHGSRLDDRR
jgi:AmiR/NasT family two-component response regulator